MISKQDYLVYAVKNKLLSNIMWVYSFLAILYKENYKNKYLKIVNSKLFVLVSDEYIELEDYKLNTIVYNIGDVYNIPKDSMLCLDKDVKTTIGYLVLNYTLVEFPFSGKVSYISSGFNIKSYEKMVGELLNTNTITVPEYKMFIDGATYLEKFSRITNISATEKNTSVPTELVAYKKVLIKEYVDKYGEDWNKDIVNITRFEDALKSKYNDYLGDDPSNDVFISGKIKNNSVLKKYISFGVTPSMKDNTLKHVEESLNDGYPKDAEKLANMFDTTRSASFDRGHETQKGGSTAKDVLRATNSIVITPNDCGVRYGKSVLVSKNIIEALVGRYMITSGNSKILSTIDDVSKYIDKKIELRSPQYCLEKNSNFCSICAGDKLNKYPNGVSLIVTDISSAMVIQSLKKTHNQNIATIEVDVTELMR